MRLLMHPVLRRRAGLPRSCCSLASQIHQKACAMSEGHRETELSASPVGHADRHKQ